MTIERRLHHAARELREVSIDPPDVAPARTIGVRTVARRAMAMAAPVVVVGAGLLGAVALLEADPGTDRGGDTAVAATSNPPARVIGPDHVESTAHPVGADARPAPSAGRTPTAVEEVAMITSLAGDVGRSARPANTTPPSNVA